MNDLLELSNDGKTLISVKDTSLKKLVIPKGVTFIYDRAFRLSI